MVSDPHYLYHRGMEAQSSLELAKGRQKKLEHMSVTCSIRHRRSHRLGCTRWISLPKPNALASPCIVAYETTKKPNFISLAKFSESSLQLGILFSLLQSRLGI